MKLSLLLLLSLSLCACGQDGDTTNNLTCYVQIGGHQYGARVEVTATSTVTHLTPVAAVEKDLTLPEVEVPEVPEAPEADMSSGDFTVEGDYCRGWQASSDDDQISVTGNLGYNDEAEK